MSEQNLSTKTGILEGNNRELVVVKDLYKHFPVRGGILRKIIGWIKAVDGVGFTIREGETLGLVGESGCCKSTIGRTILHLHEPTSGDVEFDGQNIFSLTKNELKTMRRNMQIIFQDPYASLNPRRPISDSIMAGLKIHKIGTPNERSELVMDMLHRVGLEPYHAHRYPHEFSGGQRQRIGIARAIALRPKFIVCDEPVSALDVSIQSQILNLLQDLQDEFGLTYLFIAHNLSVVEHISDRVAVMYLGKIVELAPRLELFRNALHPYTQALMSAIPIPKPNLKRERTILKGEVPSPQNPPSGCHFHPRCPVAMDICAEEAPEFVEIGPEHWVSCFQVNANPSLIQ
jgi:peptide/nickel transport system ATP-binding protein/oligopeptide transport system ATP-binding protein